MHRFIAFFATVIMATQIAHAAPKIELNGQSYETFGKRISNSSVVRLAAISKRRVAITDARAYLPAGKVLLVAKGPLCQRDGLRQWCFAVTEDGLPVFVRTDGTGFFKADGYRDEGYLGAIANARRAGRVEAADGAQLEYSTSERYRVREDDQGRAVITVTPDSQKGFDTATDVDITDKVGDFVFVNIEDVYDDASFYPIRPVNDGEVLERLIQDVAALDVDADTWKTVKEYFDNLLAREKTCDNEISLAFEAGFELVAGVGGLLSAIDTKFKITASYSKSTSYPKGLQFRARRFLQEDGTGSIRFFEIWERHQYDSADCKSVATTHLTGYDEADFGGERGDVSSDSASGLGLGVSGTQKFPSYSCDQEYFVALEHVSSQDGRLSRPAAALFVTYVMRYEGGGTGIKVCENQP